MLVLRQESESTFPTTCPERGAVWVRTGCFLPQCRSTYAAEYFLLTEVDFVI